MAADGLPPPGIESRAVSIASQVIGLVTFVCGLGMIVLVFFWTYGLFVGLDKQIAQVKPAPEATAPAATPGAKAQPPRTVVASPRTGPTLAQVCLTFALKFVALAVLAWMASLVAARGAALATGRRGP